MDENTQFRVIEHMLSEKGLIDHQIASFNHFVDLGIQKIINEENTVTVKSEQNTIYRYTFGEAHVGLPTVVDEFRTIKPILPVEARFKDITYESNIFVDIQTDVIDADTHTIVESSILRHYPLAKLPIMIGSNKCRQNYNANTNHNAECMLEPGGGYFIVRGKERVLISQERVVYNNIMTSAPAAGVTTTDFRSMSLETGHSALTQCALSNQHGCSLTLPCIAQKLPVGVVFLAYGLAGPALDAYLLNPRRGFQLDSATQTRYNRLVTAIHDQVRFLQVAVDDTNHHMMKEVARTYLTQFVSHSTDDPRDYIDQALSCEVFPHLGSLATTDTYVWSLANIVVMTMLTHVGAREPDNKDHLCNKRIECAGTLLHDLFRMSYKRFIRSMGTHLQKQTNIQTVLQQRGNTITKDIRYCFLTGNWGLQKNSYVRTGVSQIFSRLSYMASLSHLRRINMFVGREVKNVDLRQIHQSSICFIDPAETPEGAAVGVVKNFALSATISLAVPYTHVAQILMANIAGLSRTAGDGDVDVAVMLNNRPLGFIDNTLVNPTVMLIRQLRDYALLAASVSVHYDPSLDQVRVFCDEGRYMRPLFVLPAALQYDFSSNDWTFASLLDAGVVRYVDVYELETSHVAMYPNEVDECVHDYLEIHPVNMLGVVGNTIPFPEHNQAPRVVYYSSFCKQAVGTYATNLPIRVDTTAHVLDYPQKSLVTTRIARALNNDRMASGVNCIVAIANYTGLNQEDCVIINKQAIERGLFVSQAYRTITVDEKRPDSYTQYTTCLPAVSYRKPNYNYHKLDPTTGIVRKGVYVEQNDVLVGRLMRKTMRGSESCTETSIIVNMKEEGVIDDVFICTSPDGYRIIKIRVRALKILEMGDKVASVSAQKGTVGLVCPQEDMMFTSQGIVPDLIINTNAIPSRMTICMLMECVLGKACAMDGEPGDASPFTSHSTGVADQLCDRLQRNGFERSGYEEMYNGMTGEKFESQIFIGPAYYHKLKHMVSDKMYARAFGSVQMLTRQPAGGRSRMGALKIGEMERDCAIGLGVSNFLIDRLYHASDPYSVRTCVSCGTMVNNPETCEICQSDDIVAVRVPFTFKLLCKQLNGLLIKTLVFPEKF